MLSDAKPFSTGPSGQHLTSQLATKQPFLMSIAGDGCFLELAFPGECSGDNGSGEAKAASGAHLSVIGAWQVGMCAAVQCEFARSNQ
ncbi:hypothetical protein VTN77DRAFT_5189 [Rasamsonia byssochlamydoides]|uniref:uncharacterized protein n=1 Tax=Rasamsonia byssochlamydoides TaxID=89139 RepID=UPI00374358AB